ncbi:MAG: DUF456 domain-containing protein [Phycisphaerae bacterium]|nr:DUF456 domain-containing protein [Phycisphaerae bacterium]
MVDALLLIALVLLALGGTFLAALQLPGTWLILASAAGYDWYYGWQRIGWRWLVALAAVAAVAELLDTIASVAAARRAGASRRAAVGALLGGFLGMIILSVPIPIVGTIAGGLVGCFVGALVAEMTVRDDIRAGARVGLFATLGRLVGIAGKTAAAMAIAGAAVCLALRAMS